MPSFTSAKVAEQKDFGANIPDGTFVKLKGKIRPGNGNLPPDQQGPKDTGLFKRAAHPSDSIMLDWEFTVMHGPFARRQIWQNMVVDGGKVNEKGESKAGVISKQRLRAMWESGCNIDPKDASPAAEAKREFPNWSDMQGIEFAARIGIEAGGEKEGGGHYPDKNRIAIVVVPGMPEYTPVMAGQEVEPKPSGTTGGGKARGAASTDQAAKPAWQRDAAPAQAGQGAAAGPAWTQQPAPMLPGTDPRVAEAEAAAAQPGAAGPAWLTGAR